MNRFTPSKYMLFAFACAFFIGSFLYSIKIINFYIILPVLVLACLLAFTNRHNKQVLIFPLLMIIMLFGAFLYQQAAAKQSSLLQFKGKTATIQAVAAEDPISTEYGYKLLLKNVYYIKNDKLYKTAEKVQLYIRKGDKLQFGDLVLLSAKIEPAAKLRNFGDFDFESYYKSKGIYVKAFSVRITRLASNKGGLFSTFLYRSNMKVKNTIFSALPQTEAALLYGILTGSKSEIDQEVMQVFSLTGLAHILSVSGLHVGFLVLLLTLFMKPFKINNQLHSAIIFGVVLLYILLIGAPVPAVRALLMLSVMLVGKALGKNYDLNASTSFAALLLLLYNPLFIHDPSFIISFASIYSICFLHQPVSNFLSFLPSWLRSSLALSIAVWIGISPILIYYFNYISLVNVLVNVLAVPIAFLITTAGFVAVIVGIVLQPLSIFIFAAIYYLIKLLYFLSEKSLLLPFAGFNVPSMGWYVYLPYYMGLLMIIKDFWEPRSQTFKKNYSAIIVLGILIIAFINIIPGSALDIFFIDVGQGDSSVIKTPNNKTIIVDAGGSSDWERGSFDIGEKLTVPALLHIGIWRVDTLIISHIHDDHLGGVISILESFKVKQIILPASDSYGYGEYTSSNFEKLIAISQAKKIPIIYLRSNSRIKVSEDVELKMLAPEEPFIKNTDSDVNNNSLVFKLYYKSFSALFTGDIQKEGEQRIIDKAIQSDVLKVAHHGSPYSSTEDFIAKVSPKISIISVGENNNYGHPSKDSIKRIKDKQSQVFRTDISGAIKLSTDGIKLKIRTVRQNPDNEY